MINPANIGYLPGIILKELRAGHQVEIVGSVCTTIKNNDDYERNKDRVIGKFGEVWMWGRDGVTKVATRDPPPWAKRRIHEMIWDCPEMLRWEASEEER